MITEKIARFIIGITPEKIPGDAFEIARRGVTDFCGVALAGSREETGNIISGLVREMGGAAQSGVIGKGFRTTPHLAALANGTMGHALDYDDLSFTYGAHPSVTLAPVVLALGESLGATGKEVLTAYIVGFEAGACISSPVAQSHYLQGWHSTGTVGVMGAAATAARLLKLDIHQIIMAFGLAASMASGLRQNFGTMTKPFHAGLAASNGVLAALLAQRGFTAHESAIEAYAKVLGCNDEIDWNKAAATLGKTFIIAKGIGFKPYPSCGGTLGVADAALYLRNKFKPDVSLIEAIILGVGPFENRSLIHRPHKGLEGKFSMEYCVCRALWDGKLTLKDFSDERVNQPEIQKLISRVNCEERYPMAVMGADSSGLNPQSVTIRMKDGKEYFRETPLNAGMPVSAMTEAQLEAKFRDCASLVLDKKQVEKSLSLLRDLAALPDIRELMKIISNITPSSVPSPLVGEG
jgi:2-methylcitrate dehydratase PrpD